GGGSPVLLSAQRGFGRRVRPLGRRSAAHRGVGSPAAGPGRPLRRAGVHADGRAGRGAGRRGGVRRPVRAVRPQPRRAGGGRGRGGGGAGGWGGGGGAGGGRARACLPAPPSRAPPPPGRGPPIHQLPDAALVEWIDRRYGSLPPEVREDAELLQLVLPAY